MQPERQKIPGVLLLLLSALGIFIGLLALPLAVAASRSLPAGDETGRLALLSAGALGLLVGLLNIPTFGYTIRFLRQKDGRVRQPSLFKSASIFLLLWFGLLGLGHWVSRSAGLHIWLAPLTAIAVLIPIWWIVEFLRRGHPRSTALREWGSLTIGLTISPVLVMLLELVMLGIMAVIGLIVLGLQSGALEQLSASLQALQAAQGGMGDLERWLAGLSGNPLVVSLVFLSIGFIAPLIEELFKPMAIWFLLKRPLTLSEGYSLGLISGGAFALMESASLVIQISVEEWVAAVALRAATGFLHIALSGMVGYGLASAWQHRKPGRALLVLLAATGLHGFWNSMALIAGFSETALPAPVSQPVLSPAAIAAAGLMGAVITLLIGITWRLNRKLRPARPDNPPDNQSLLS